ncbi:MAG: NAD(P)/FAD-dependent oxidoreductase [Oscillospiraceae bacterium]|nr:NAD(P)/FAD-dependent oxidoreductase [Oscillospiraceae bacterium]
MSGAALSYDIAVIGGGASGLAAAVFAARIAQGRFSVALLEKAPRVGRKLLATGNGTCNISNKGAVAERYHGTHPEFVIPSLDRFSPDAVCSFFTSIGVECIQREDGRIYPQCLHAGAVLDCLRMELDALGIHNIPDTAVTHIKKMDGGFQIKTSSGEIQARRVLVCTGGAASPSLGGSAEAYSLLTDIGHHLTPIFPSIVQVRTDTKFIKAVKGIRVEAQISFELDGRRLAFEKGEVLFTEYGLSGPAVMQISRFVAEWERRSTGKMAAVLNVLPDLDENTLLKTLRRRALMKGRSLGDLLTGLLQKRLGQTIMRAAGYDLNESVNILSESDLLIIAKFINRWEIEVTGTQGMRGAQVTAGGIATADFNPETMESRLIPGLYAAGEVLDIDGDCGGFNLQWAWASGFTAAEEIVKSLQ